MAFDPASLLTVSHLVTFILGALTGAAATYLADKYTDRRREQEARGSSAKGFRELKILMPALVADMRSALAGDASKTIREFAVLANPGIMFNTSRNRFVFYETTHRDLANQLSLLEEAGFVTRRPPPNESSPPVFWMEPRFVELVRAS